MNPYVEPAQIAAGVSLLSLGGTVFVAIAGFRNTRKATTRTVDAGTANTKLALDAARGDRLWDAQAAAYVDAIRILRHRVFARREHFRSLHYDNRTEADIAASIAGMAHPEFADAEARVMAYATPSVLAAIEVSAKANDKVISLVSEWRSLQRQAAAAQEGHADAVEGDTIRAAMEAAVAAAEAADDKDDELFAAIRADLHNKPSQALAPGPGLTPDHGG